mgnify:CR=1 FL=1
MPLVPCRACGHTVDTSAEACPGCGATDPGRKMSRQQHDLIVLLMIAVPGGMITALFSVGIGELVALYLFIRHYPVLLCTGAACLISSVSVISGAIWHVEAGTIQLEVVLLAGPAAALGGFLARPIAIRLGARRLKTLDGAWIVLSAVYLLWLNWG